MTVTVSRWGNSQGVRLPKEVLELAHVQEGDELHILAEPGRLVLTPVNAAPTLAELIERITPENSHAPVFETIVGAERW